MDQIESIWNRIFCHTYFAKKTKVWNEDTIWDDWVDIFTNLDIYDNQLTWNKERIEYIKSTLLESETKYNPKYTFYNSLIKLISGECNIINLLQIIYRYSIHIHNIEKSNNVEYIDVLKDLDLIKINNFIIFEKEKKYNNQ